MVFPLRDSLSQINEENGREHPAGGLKLPELPGLKNTNKSEMESFQSKLNPALQLMSRNQGVLEGNSSNSYITKIFNT